MGSWKWARLGAAAALAVMLAEAGKQLGAIETANARAYDAATFTGPKIAVWDTATLRNALTFWLDPDNVPVARALLNWHVGLDLLFLGLLGGIAAQLLTALDVPQRRRRAAVWSYVAFDLGETLLTLGVVNLGYSTWTLIVLQVLTLLKWAALADVVLLAITSPVVKAGANVSVFKDAPAVPARAAMIGQWALVVIFAALIALPGGGPLEQLPDILRQQLADHLAGTFLLGTLCVLGLTVAMVVSGAIGLRAAAAGPPTRRSWSVVAVVGAVTLVLGVVQQVLEGWSPVTLAPLIVVGVVQAAAWWRDLFAPAENPPLPVPVDATSDPPAPTTATRSGTGRGVVALLANLAIVVVVQLVAWWRDLFARAEAAPLPVPVDATSDPPAPTTATRLGTLGGAVAMLAGLGLVRATAPYLVLGLPGARWRIFFAVGFATALLSVGVARWLLETLVPMLGARLLLMIMITTPALVIVAAGALAVRPDVAWLIGANGVLAVWLALASMVVAGFQLLSRRVAVWTATQSLGLGQRTPWGLLAVAVYVVASVVNTAGRYHDVRVADAAATDIGLGARYAYSNVDEALGQWIAARDAACEDDRRPVPLVLVAAPGGGIRAALWTAAGLDRLFPTECARSTLFAISGASGGSVGATVWQAARGDGTSATDAVTAMSGPEPLAAGLAGMLMRDLPQPITGLTRQWRDRAAVMEDEWVDTSGVLGSTSDPLLWSELRSEEGWAPVLVLNSSSVTDGCRVVISNTAGLPSATGGGCTSPRDAGGGPISGAVDPLATLRSLEDGGYGPCASGELSAVSAAMLSARFPYVTPSGALHICPAGAEPDADPDSGSAVYAVDGGYVENSGILAAIELVDEIEDGPYGARIEPWIVVLDNHYRSAALQAPPSRPKELVVPLETLRNKPGLSQIVLEQMAAERLWDDTDDTAECSRLIRVGPAKRPDLAAPLGWTLSTDTVERLLGSMDTSIGSLAQAGSDTSSGVEADACSSALLGFLDVSKPGDEPDG